MTGGVEEFVLMDLISVKESNYVFIIEAKASSLGQAMEQCLLSMKDARDDNGGGVLYGFITTGESWKVLKYDGASFQMTRKIDILFDGMDQERELWMKVTPFWLIARCRIEECGYCDGCLRVSSINIPL